MTQTTTKFTGRFGVGQHRIGRFGSLKGHQSTGVPLRKSGFVNTQKPKCFEQENIQLQDIRKIAMYWDHQHGHMEQIFSTKFVFPQTATAKLRPFNFQKSGLCSNIPITQFCEVFAKHAQLRTVRPRHA